MEGFLNSVQNAVQNWLNIAQSGQTGTAEAVISVLALTTGAGLLINRHAQHREQKRKVFADYSYEKESDDLYDIAIVGAGPSGSTMAFYLKKNGFEGKIALIDKAPQFPRDKYCGDAVARMASRHLKTMGVYEDLVKTGKGRVARQGGFYSPLAFLATADSSRELGEPVVTAIKRWNLDNAIFQSAKAKGATTLLGKAVDGDKTWFDAKKGIWNVQLGDSVVRAKLLVCADGAGSGLATKLTNAAKNADPEKFGGGGYVVGPHQGECTRHYIKGATGVVAEKQIDGMVFYPPELLPGYCAIIRESDNDINFCTYVIPGGPVKNAGQFHEKLMKDQAGYPILNYYLPEDVAVTNDQPAPERGMKADALRLGALETVPKTFGNHLLIIGDAAGFIDPLTGEGIQYAMESGYIASGVISDAFKKGDLSANYLKNYQVRWGSQWGREFWWSMRMSLMMYYFPTMVDAAAKLIQKKGSTFLAEWAEVMTGTESKTWFFKPHVWPGLLVEWAIVSIQTKLQGRNLLKENSQTTDIKQLN